MNINPWFILAATVFLGWQVIGRLRREVDELRARLRLQTRVVVTKTNSRVWQARIEGTNYAGFAVMPRYAVGDLVCDYPEQFGVEVVQQDREAFVHEAMKSIAQ